MRARFKLLLLLLQPILAPLIFLVVIGSAAYLLPFAKITYRMHVIDSKSSSPPINILTDDTIQLDVMIYGVCTRQSKEKLQQIRTKKKILLDAGNTSDEISAETYSNRLQMILKTKLTRINNFICGDNVHMNNNDQQYATFVAAGLVSLLFLILAECLSLFAIAVHTLTIIQWALKKESINCISFKEHWSVDLLVKSSSSLVIFASFVYMTLSWNERRSSYAAFGSGYIIMLVTGVVASVGIHCRDYLVFPNRENTVEFEVSSQ